MHLKKELKNKLLQARITPLELNKIKLRANLYTGGNVSAWLVYAATNYKPGKRSIK